MLIHLKLTNVFNYDIFKYELNILAYELHNIDFIIFPKMGCNSTW